MSFVVAIFFTISIEFFAHCLETRFKARIHLVMLNKVYKELMMVGVIGLMINMSESIGLFHILYKWTNAILKFIGLNGSGSSGKVPETEVDGML